MVHKHILTVSTYGKNTDKQNQQMVQKVSAEDMFKCF